MITKKCLYCGKKYQVHNYLKYISKYCSKSCANKSKKGKAPANKGKYYKLICLNCNNEFEVPERRKDAKYCSYKCYWACKMQSQEERDAHSNKLKEYYKTHKAHWTGKKRGPTPLYVRKKLSDAIRGSKAYQWKGGITKLNDLVRKSPIYVLWRQSIFKRDNWACKLCNSKVKINCHHIKSFKDIMFKNKIKSRWDAYKCAELWDMNNAITLCEECHKDIHRGLKNVSR